MANIPEQLNKEITDKYTTKDNTFIQAAKVDISDKLDVEVGDSKQTDFYPQVKIMRWDNEVNFSARLVHDEKTPSVSTDSDKIIWSGDKVDCNFYDIKNEEHPDGGYEFEVILKEKPKTNVVTFTIDTKGLDFFYQGEIGEDDEEGGYRPDNVIGSYAVYTSEEKINYEGGTEYKSGKVGHIYRPRIEDANGDWTWGELNIDKGSGLLTVTIPQKFLDNAIYPVRHAAGLTFGYTTVGATRTSGLAVDTIRSWVYAPGTSGTIKSISFYTSLGTSSTTNYLRGVVYLGSDLSRVTYGSEVQNTSASFAWVSLPLTDASITAVNYNTNTTLRPKLVLNWTPSSSTPTIPDYYKIPVNIYKGDATVEGSSSVDPKSWEEGNVNQLWIKDLI